MGARRLRFRLRLLVSRSLAEPVAEPRPVLPRPFSTFLCLLFFRSFFRFLFRALSGVGRVLPLWVTCVFCYCGCRIRNADQERLAQRSEARPPPMSRHLNRSAVFSDQRSIGVLKRGISYKTSFASCSVFALSKHFSES